LKLIITTTGQTLDAPMDRRFGRAAHFLLYDLETEAYRILDNDQNLQAAQGAGIQAAQNVVNSGAQAVITGHCGPKAFRVLSAANVAIYNCGADTVADAIDQYKSGQLKPAQSADVEGHWV
jgi:predicted Fe-Mo cluster-binding NifX family protein